MFDSEDQFNQLRALLGELIRVGVVTSTDDEAATARVQFRDRNGVVSYDLRVTVRNTKDNKDYWMPDINEQVLCLFLPTGIETGYIVGSFYSAVTAPPASTKNKRRVEFSDGAYAEYDRSTKKLTAYTPGDASVETGKNLTANVGGDAAVNVAGKTDLVSPTINLTGVVNVDGALNLTGPFTATGGASGSGVSVQGDLEIDGGVAVRDNDITVTNGDVIADGQSLKS